MPRSTKWTSATKLALIHEYRKYPILWQRGHRNAKFTPAKLKAWCAIATKLRMPVRECQKKILSCKAVYRKIKRLVRMSHEGEVIRHASWFGYEHMKFLDQNTRSSKQSDSLNEEQHSDSSGEHEVEDSPGRQTACVYVKQEALDDVDLLSVGEPSIGGSDGLGHHTPQNSTNVRVMEPAGMFATMPIIIDRDEVTHFGWSSSSMKADDHPPFDAFGRYVAAELDNMPRKAAIVLQQQLHQCIIDAKLQAIGP